MTLSLDDLEAKLIQLDEISLLEVLDISSEDIVNRFEDYILDQYDFLIKEFDEGEEWN